MPSGLHPNGPDKNLLERSLRELAEQDKKLAAVMSDEVRLIGMERKKLNETKRGESSRLKKSGLDQDTVDIKLATLENFYAKNSARLDKRLMALQDRLVKDLEDEDQSRLEKSLEKEQKEKVEDVKEKKQFYKELRVSVSDAVGDGMKEASVKTFDTLLGPLKLITKPIEELTGKSMSDFLGGMIESKQEKSRATRNDRIGYGGRGRDLLGDDNDDQLELPPGTEPGLLGAPTSAGVLPAPVSLESIDENASLRVHVDNWDGMVDAVRGLDSSKGTSGFGYELLPDEEPGAIGPPTEAPGLLGAPVAPLALPSPEMLDARIADDSNRDESVVIDELRPHTVHPTRPEMLHDGLIGAQAVYITDTLLGKEGPPSEKEKKGGSIVGDLIGADLGANLIKTLMPALIAALPEILMAAGVVAAIAGVGLLLRPVFDKADKEKTDILKSLTPEQKKALAAQGIDVSDVSNVEEARAVKGLATGTAATTTNLSNAETAATLVSLPNQRIAAATISAAKKNEDVVAETLGDYTSGGYYFWKDKDGQLWAAKDPTKGVKINDISDPTKQKIVDRWASKKENRNSTLPGVPWSGGTIGYDQESVAFDMAMLAGGGKPIRFDRGGTVPGPDGQPTPVIAEGGETFVPTHDRKFRENLDVMLDSTMTRGTPLDRHVASMNKNEPMMIDDAVNDRVVDALRELIDVIKSQQRRPRQRTTESAGAGPDLDSLRLGG
jgi:hypothetical protein